MFSKELERFIKADINYRVGCIKGMTVVEADTKWNEYGTAYEGLSQKEIRFIDGKWYIDFIMLSVKEEINKIINA